MNASMAKEQLVEAAHTALRSDMFVVLQRDLLDDQKLSILEQQYSGHLLIEGKFSATKQALVGIKTLSFEGTIGGKRVGVSVC